MRAIYIYMMEIYMLAARSNTNIPESGINSDHRNIHFAGKFGYLIYFPGFSSRTEMHISIRVDRYVGVTISFMNNDDFY